MQALFSTSQLREEQKRFSSLRKRLNPPCCTKNQTIESSALAQLLLDVRRDSNTITHHHTSPSHMTVTPYKKYVNLKEGTRPKSTGSKPNRLPTGTKKLSLCRERFRITCR